MEESIKLLNLISKKTTKRKSKEEVNFKKDEGSSHSIGKFLEDKNNDDVSKSISPKKKVSEKKIPPLRKIMRELSDKSDRQNLNKIEISEEFRYNSTASSMGSLMSTQREKEFSSSILKKPTTIEKLNLKLIKDYDEKLQAYMKEEDSAYENELIRMQSELYKYNNETKSFNLFYAKLMHQFLCYYKSPNDFEEEYGYQRMHYLGGCFVNKADSKSYKSKMFYCFSITYNKNNKIKKYYHPDEKVIKKWMEEINKANNYKNFFSDYTLGDNLGKGQYGVVKIGFEKILINK